MTPLQLLIVYTVGAIVTTMLLGAYFAVKEYKFEPCHLIIILVWPFTWLCLLIALIFGMAYWIGGNLAEIVKDIID